MPLGNLLKKLFSVNKKKSQKRLQLVVAFISGVWRQRVLHLSLFNFLLFSKVGNWKFRSNRTLLWVLIFVNGHILDFNRNNWICFRFSLRAENLRTN